MGFSTPIMLKMYCKINNLELKDINSQYHIIPCIINMLIYPLKNTKYYNYFFIPSCILLMIFIKRLFELKKNSNYKFTDIYIYIWFLFIFITLIDMVKIYDKYTINIFYLCTDFIGKNL